MGRKQLKREEATESAAVAEIASPPVNGKPSTNDQDAITSGDANNSLSCVGRGIKRFVQAVQTLRQLGVEELNLPLPKIVVVGDQSTGKSSLIEAMSEIKVPRSAGTCTRCPLEMNITESSTSKWSCEVYLCEKYIYEGYLQVPGNRLRRSEGATKERPLGPWIQQDPESYHFATVESKEQLPSILRLAQLATLNPDGEYEAYLPGAVPAPSEALQVKFSPNIVRLDINGPGLPNLAFYDLPGVINVADVPEESYLVDLVKNLVKTYVFSNNSINLLALAMTDDPANSSASQLIRQLKAEPRTIGCLTKPDRLQEGESLEQWTQILRGERFQLGFGYYVIKNDPDPSVDHGTARARESDFFVNKSPWTTVLASSSHRFGTEVLQTALSQRLTSEIQKSLPHITAQVHEKMLALNTNLNRLPEPVQGNLPAVVLGELIKLQQEIESHFDGGRKDRPFQKEWNKLASDFRKDLESTKPVISLKQSRSTFTPQTTPTPRSNASHASGTITVDSDDDGIPATPSPQTGSKRPITSNVNTPNKVQRASNLIPSTAQSSCRSKCFTFMEIRSMIQDAYAGGIANLIPPTAVEEMVKSAIDHWGMILEQFLDKTEQLCANMAYDRVKETFGHRNGTRFYDQIIDICELYFRNLFSRQKFLCKQILKWEQVKPKTMNEDFLALARDRAAQILQARSREHRANEAIDEIEKKSGKTSTGPARTEKIMKLPDSQLKPEMNGLELETMSVSPLQADLRA